MESEKIGNSESPSLKEKYKEKIDVAGYLSVGDFATIELGRQSKSIAAFLDGDSGTNEEINFGNDLRYIGDSGNYSDMKIHIDDLDMFIKRIKAHYGDD